MLGKYDAIPTVAVKNLAAAKKFYEGTLGLQQIDAEGDEVAVYQNGDTRLNVYRSQFAGTNKATAVTWAVDDVDKEVRELKSKGVAFEHYDMPELKLQGDVHVAQRADQGADLKVAWFKDPDGNIFSIVNRD
jgi:catechol 2,3-dioxygenase-like lactoylglutathione lyase family enzyme